MGSFIRLYKPVRYSERNFGARRSEVKFNLAVLFVVAEAEIKYKVAEGKESNRSKKVIREIRIITQ